MHFYWGKVPFKEEGVNLPLTLNRSAVTLWMLRNLKMFLLSKQANNSFLGLYGIQTQILPLTCNTTWVTNDLVYVNRLDQKRI